MSVSPLFTKRALLLVAVLFLFGSLYSQPNLVNYNVEHGLPSPETYYLYQSQDGYIWVCSDRGVARYNGYEFEEFSMDDGLTHNTVFKVFEDKNNNLYFTCYDGSITLYDYRTKRFSPFWANNKIVEKLNGTGWISYVAFSNDSIYLQPAGSSQYHFSYRMAISLKDSSISIERYHGPASFQFDNIVHKIKSLYSEDYIIDEFATKQGSTKWNEGFVNEYKRKALYHKMTRSIRYNEQNIFYVSKNGVSVVSSTDSIFYDIDGATDAIKDREGNYWFSTENRGVYKLQPTVFSNYQSVIFLKKGDKLSAINGNKDNIYLGTKHGNIFEYDINTKEISKLGNIDIQSTAKGPYEIKNITNLNGKLLVAMGYEIYLQNGRSKISKLSHGLATEGFAYRGQQIVTYSSSAIFIYNSFEGLKTVKSPLLKKEGNHSSAFKKNYGFGVNKMIQHNANIISTTVTPKQQIFFSTLQGFYKLDSNYSVINITKKNKLENTAVRKIISGPNGGLILATTGKGVIIINERKKQPTIINKGLLSNMVNDIALGSDGTMWCATTKGISHISYSQNGDSNIIIKNYSKENGLGATYVSKIFIHKDIVYAISEQGLISFPENIALPELPLPKMLLTNWYQGDNVLPFEHQIFAYDENSIKIDYLGIAIQKPIGKPFYRYKLKRNNLKAEWVYTNNRGIAFDQLIPGEYKFLVSARNINNQWSASKKCTFIIRPHWVDTWWARSLGGLLFGLIVYYLYLRDRERRKKRYDEQLALSQLREKLKSTELDVLRGQMNPHFIYNSLNSVQKFLIKDNKLAANEFISRLAKLLRAGLEYSREDYIQLDKEIEFIENYMTIETQRFPDRFSYAISVDERLDLDLGVPPLMVQGLCENAIKHAYGGSPVAIKINFNFHSEDLICIVVEDDGVGILNRKEPTVIVKKSLGLDIISKRIDIFRERNADASFRYEALNAELKKGTRAILILPII